MTFNVTTDMYLPLLRKHEGRQGTGDREPSPVSHNFIRMVEGFERNLSFIIKQEKEMKRRAAIGELGVRVQNSHISDPTAREAIDNMMIEQAIREGDLTEVIAELDEDIRRIHGKCDLQPV